MQAVPMIGDAWEAAERAISGELEDSCGVHLSDLLALDRIYRAGRGGIRTNTLARALRIPSNRLTYQLAGLQKRGLIEKSSHPDDGRGVVLRLTGEGLKVNRKAFTAYRRITRDGLSGLDAGIDSRRILDGATILAGDVPAANGTRRRASGSR